MSDIITKLNSYSNKNYKHLADYLLSVDNYEELTSNDLQNECHVSAGTVTKFVRSLGYTHFLELKYALITSSKLRKKGPENLILSILLRNEVNESHSSLFGMLAENDHNIVIASDLDNINLASELNSHIIKTQKKSVRFCQSFSTLVSIVERTTEATTVIFIGNMNEQLEYAMKLNQNIKAYNLNDESAAYYKPRAENIKFLKIPNDEFGSLSLFMYIGILIWNLCPNCKNVP